MRTATIADEAAPWPAGRPRHATALHLPSPGELGDAALAEEPDALLDHVEHRVGHRGAHLLRGHRAVEGALHRGGAEPLVRHPRAACAPAAGRARPARM